MTATATELDRTPPGVSSWRVLPELQALRRDPLGWVLDRRARWGDTFRLNPPLGLLGPEFTWACGPDGIRDVLTAEEFEKGSPVYREMAGALGDGLLTSQGDTWRAQRRTLQPLFTKKRVERYAGAFAGAAESVVADWRDGALVDLAAEMQLMSLRSVGVTLFGTDVTDQVEPIVTATDYLSERVVARGLAPIAIPSWVPTPEHRRLAAAQHDLGRRVDALVAAQREGAAERDDLVALLLHATDPETGAPLTPVEVREQALVFLLAGNDTTSTALTFSLHLLARHPAIQDAVREEVRDTVVRGDLTAADAARFELTRRVVDEAMRLYPPAYITSRLALRDTAVAGYRVARGGVVATSFYALHRNPGVWDDPERFNPDRFLPAAVKERDRYAYLPFGGGPRSCIGNHFALLEATLGVASVIGRFSLESRTDHVPLNLGITLRPAAAVLAEVRAV
jgi:cytochrome P450